MPSRLALAAVLYRDTRAIVYCSMHSPLERTEHAVADHPDGNAWLPDIYGNMYAVCTISLRRTQSTRQDFAPRSPHMVVQAALHPAGGPGRSTGITNCWSASWVRVERIASAKKKKKKTHLSLSVNRSNRVRPKSECRARAVCEDIEMECLLSHLRSSKTGEALMVLSLHCCCIQGTTGERGNFAA